jgi:hypothetical protein
MPDGHWAARRLSASAAITTDVLEKCLDRLAQIIVQAGEKGVVYLPIYERLEAELEKARAIEARLARVRGRVKQ